MHDDVIKDVKDLKTAMWGDRSDPNGWPGVISELMRSGIEQKRTNEILTELRNAFIGILVLFGGGFISAICAFVFKTPG